jgi:hypothetical protein
LMVLTDQNLDLAINSNEFLAVLFQADFE